jgi:PAS domain S-box-containing protein
MADAVIYADRGGKIQLWNRAASALFGFEAAEALSSSIDIIVPERASPTGVALRPLWRAAR